MQRWLRRIRGAIGMGITWAIGWAVAGVALAAAWTLLPGFPPLEWFFKTFDAPAPALAVPGLFGGAIFSVVLGIAARRRRFSELSLPRFTAWGAAGGLLLSLVPAAIVTVGLGTLNPKYSLWGMTAAISVPLILLSAASAASTLWIAKKGEARASLEGNEELARAGPSA